MKENMMSVLKKVAIKLNESGLTWALCGGLGQNLQGFDNDPNDIDLSIFHKDLENVKKLFKDYKQTEMITFKNGEAQEFKIFIDNIEVQFCGDYDHGIYAIKLKDKENIGRVDLDGVPVNVMKLEPELECYIHINQRPEKIERLKQHLSRGMKFRVIVAVVIRKGDLILVGEKAKDMGPYPNQVHFPGGGYRLGQETSDEAIIREIREETGLSVKNLKKIAWNEDQTNDKKGELTHYTFLEYSCDWTAGELEATDDLALVRWVHKDDLTKENLNKPARELYEKLLSQGYFH